MNKQQLDARTEYAESILRGLPKTEPTIAVDSILTYYEAEDREEVLESIQAYADIRVRQAIFVIYEAARATADRDSAELEALRELQRTVEYQIAHGNGTLAIEASLERLRALKSQQDAAIESQSGKGESNG